MTSPLRLVQRGPEGGPLAVFWLVGSQLDDALRASLPDCTILASATVDLNVSAAAIAQAAPWATGKFAIGGWSGGVQSVRKLLLDGLRPAAVFSVDGTHANYPTPAPWQIDVWRELAARSRAGDCLWAATCSQNTYVESIHDDPFTPQIETPFMATVHVLERATGLSLPPGSEAHDNGMHVFSVPSARIDKAAHEAQLTTWMPRLLRDYVAPWLALAPSSRPPATLPTGTRLLRIGMVGDDVQAWQGTLNRLGYHVDCDGRFGGRTADATRMLQHDHRLTEDGIVGPRTRAAAEAAPAPVPLARPDWPALRPYVPLSDEERAAIFGRFDFAPAPTPDNPEGIRILGDWEARNIVSVELPQVAGIPGAPASRRVSFHRLGAAALTKLWQAWADAGVLPDVVQFSGTWNPRFVRGSRTELSNHAWGTAIDLNAGYNARGTQGAAKGARGDMRRLVDIALELGWETGHFFPVRDDMHLQLGRKAIGDPNL